MTKRIYLIQLMLFVAAIVYGQDTLFFDGMGKKVKSLDLATMYKTLQPNPYDVYHPVEITHLKSGSIKKVEPQLVEFKKNTDNLVIKAFENRKVNIFDDYVAKSINKKLDGIYKEWYDNGQLKKEVAYTADKLNGYYYSYWINGQIKRRDTYKEDKLVEGKCFNNAGEEITYFPTITMPDFPGGVNAMMAFLSQNIRYPIAMQEYGVKGVVILQFYVEKDGTLTNIKVLRSLHPDGDAESKRVVSLMPKWKPGTQDGEPVAVQFTLPIKYSMK
ncbi:energy transducer TonB [Parabacteroides sp. FAFU027]|uniref:energy transducer TonB n=1 Tax=Parabacteroides sp. FAFU027 TaxID=2922715 RepID=UPI001FAF7DA3|nr:energy transducer TonB [Parabacteroides sp. FAFU027]